MRRNPGFAAAGLLTLALGIGATTAVFSVVYGVLMRPLPYPEADRLVQLSEEHPGAVSPLQAPLLSNLTLLRVERAPRTIEAVAAYRSWYYTVHACRAAASALDRRRSHAVVVLAARPIAGARPLLPARTKDGKARQRGWSPC